MDISDFKLLAKQKARPEEFGRMWTVPFPLTFVTWYFFSKKYFPCAPAMIALLMPIKSAVKKGLSLFRLEITRNRRVSADLSPAIADLSPEVRCTIESARHYTMTSLERLSALCTAVEYVVENNIPGAFVECGVWRGGSSMAAAWTYRRLGREDVDLFLFDTFEGMSEPTAEDVLASTGEAAKDLLAASDKQPRAGVWSYAPIEDVRRNLESTGYPADHVHFVKGKVEKTIPSCAPEEISILRLDTDWYESTKHELIYLFPRLSKNGVLIIDDYGHWAGARKAVDEYFATLQLKPLLNRIDYTGRICLKS